MTGWICVSRAIFDHELFASEPMSEREAWLWLVAKAAWKDTRHRIGLEVVPVPRGTMFCTLRELRDEWRWKSDFRVRSFLEILEREAMIERNANAGKTHLTICNYNKYQSPNDDHQRAGNATETHEKRTENALKIPVYQDTKEDTSLRSVSRDGANEREKPILEKKKKPPDKNRGSRLPENWHPGDDWLNFTSSEGLTNDDAKRELENFRDYWRGIAGSRGVKLDWLATWRNRVRDVSARAKRFPQRSQAGGGRAEPSSTLGAYQRAAARFHKPVDFPGRSDFEEDNNGPILDLPGLEN